MSLLTVALVIIVVGVLLYVANKFLPMDGNIRKILNAVVVIVLVVWLLRASGLLDWLEHLMCRSPTARP